MYSRFETKIETIAMFLTHKDMDVSWIVVLQKQMVKKQHPLKIMDDFGGSPILGNRFSLIFSQPTLGHPWSLHLRNMTGYWKANWDKRRIAFQITSCRYVFDTTCPAQFSSYQQVLCQCVNGQILNKIIILKDFVSLHVSMCKYICSHQP